MSIASVGIAWRRPLQAMTWMHSTSVSIVKKLSVMARMSAEFWTNRLGCLSGINKKMKVERKIMGKTTTIELELGKGEGRKGFVSKLDVALVTSGRALAPGKYEVVLRRTDVKPKIPSRMERWNDAASQASDAFNELQEIQQEYQEWNDNLPENMQGTTQTSEKLEAVCDIDIDSGVSAADEAQNADLPGMFEG